MKFIQKLLFTLTIFLPLASMDTPGSSSIRQTASPQIVRAQFFQDILGMSEGQFKKQFSWHKGKLTKPPRGNARKTWVAQYPRRAAIFEGDYRFVTIGNLKTKVQRKRKPGRGTFTLLIHDPNNPQLTDIRYLQSDPKNNGACFQLASTFWGPLEGGMFRSGAKLTGMLHAPVQGEEASISAAGATIFRKYFLPHILGKGYTDQSHYLLTNLFRRIPYKWVQGKPKIDWRAAQKYTNNPNDINKVGIGIHSDIFVTSGWGQGTTQEQIPLSSNQKITQIFSSALNTTPFREKKSLNKNVRDLAKMLLNASYEGALYAAFGQKCKNLYLTLMGGGSFRNDISWIAHAIQRMKNFIKYSGINVILVFRPDKPRKLPIRTAQGDIDFLQNMIQMADEINGTCVYQPAIQKVISNYVTNAYAGKNYETEAIMLKSIFEQ